MGYSPNYIIIPGGPGLEAGGDRMRFRLFDPVARAELNLAPDLVIVVNLGFPEQLTKQSRFIYHGCLTRM